MEAGKIYKMEQFASMLYQSRDGVFTAWFDVKRNVTENVLLKVFILLGKYYPEYIFKSDDFSDHESKWEEYILKDFVYRPDRFNNIYLTHEVYVQDQSGTVLKIKPGDETIELIYGMDDDIPIFGIQIYPYVYFDENFIIKNHKERKDTYVEIVDQYKAARLNRSFLTGLLKEMEELLEADIKEIEGGKYFSENHMFRYGIKEDAVLNKRK